MLKAYTLLHVIISLVGIAAGLAVLCGLLINNPMDEWTAVFLASTVATSATGFFFPFKGFKPSYVVGIISLIVLAVSIRARYAHHLAGQWLWIYVVSAVTALYLNVFVFVVQAFQKVPSLNALAPTQTEAPFKWAQLAVLAAFVVLGTLAVFLFHPQPL